jgi:hypothetical protein
MLVVNKRERKKANQRKTNDFKECMVEDCTKAVTSKTAMFQIYL